MIQSSPWAECREVHERMQDQRRGEPSIDEGSVEYKDPGTGAKNMWLL